jgi:hypothetical protein
MRICNNKRKTLTQLNSLVDMVLILGIMHLYMHYMHYPLPQIHESNKFVIVIQFKTNKEK